MKKDFLNLATICILVFGVCFEGLAQKALEEELLFIEIPVVSVASIKAINIRESPGIVTVITSEEITNLGARDLIDVLRLVPGFEFGVDVENTVSVGVRGNWAQEGKVLLLWNGQELNEPLYASLQLGNHFPVEQIERVEIIRGPGSAIYGGYAELAVINIITKSLDGFELTLTDGEMNKTFAHRNISLSYGKEFRNGLQIGGYIFTGKGNRSDQKYTDFNGDSFDMSENSQLNPLNTNLKLNYKGLKTNFLVDNYHITQADGMGIYLQDEVSTEFNSYF